MNRRGFFTSLALVAASAPAIAALPAVRLEEGQDPALQDIQHRGRHGGRRCRWETRQVRFRDRWGQVRWRTVRREVCW